MGGTFRHGGNLRGSAVPRLPATAIHGTDEERPSRHCAKRRSFWAGPFLSGLASGRVDRRGGCHVRSIRLLAPERPPGNDRARLEGCYGAAIDGCHEALAPATASQTTTVSRGTSSEESSPEASYVAHPPPFTSALSCFICRCPEFCARRVYHARPGRIRDRRHYHPDLRCRPTDAERDPSGYAVEGEDCIHIRNVNPVGTRSLFVFRRL